MRFEYKAVNIDSRDYPYSWDRLTILNNYGYDGWELVCVHENEFIFKRQIIEKKD